MQIKEGTREVMPTLSVFRIKPMKSNILQFTFRAFKGKEFQAAIEQQAKQFRTSDLARFTDNSSWWPLACTVVANVIKL